MASVAEEVFFQVFAYASISCIGVLLEEMDMSVERVSFNLFSV